MVHDLESKERLKQKIVLLENLNKKVEKYLKSLGQEKDKNNLGKEYLGVSLMDEVTEYTT